MKLDRAVCFLKLTEFNFLKDKIGEDKHTEAVTVEPGRDL